MTASLLQASFTSGELSPSLHARADLAKYHSGVKLLHNFLVHRHGGVSNRPGTKYVTNTRGDARARLIPFQFSVQQSYVLEFTDQCIRIIKDGGLIVYPEGHEAEGDVVEIETPYLEADIRRIAYVQSADILYLVHPGYAPRQLSRTDHHAWSLSEISFGSTLSPPTGLVNGGSGNTVAVTAVGEDKDESVLSETATVSNTGTVSWNEVEGADYYKVYMALNGIFGWVADVEGTSWTNTTLKPDMEHVAPSAANPFGENYPGSVTIYQQRLIFGRTDERPQTTWGSRTGSYRNFNKSNPLRDDDPFEFTMDSAQVNEIFWMIGLRNLVIGTAGGEWEMSPGGDGTLGPNSVKLTPQSNWGSAPVPPILVGNSILFVQTASAAVRDLAYSLESDGYQGNDLTILAEHIVRDHTLLEWSYARDPDSIVWVVRDDGVLLSLTYERAHQVWAWARHTTPGGAFESVTTIRDGDGHDEAYAVVRRVVDGQTVRFVEHFARRLPNADVVEGIFLDATSTYRGEPITTISAGLEYLEGETVSVIADGNVHSGLVVEGGGITLPAPASVIHIGIPYVSELETLEPDPGGESNTIRDRKRRVTGISVQLENTRSLKAGPNADHVYEMPFRTTENYGDPVRLFTGLREINIDPSWGAGSASVYIRHDEPSPITILAMIPRVEIGG